jgi:hypothetical protein
MTRPLVGLALACLAMTAVAPAAELAPGAGHGIRLAGFDGVVYYTVAHDGYQVVATLASGAEALPIRFSSTLRPGQAIVISVPRSAGEPAIDFEIVRNGEALIVNDPIPVPAAGLDDASTRAALVK